MERAAYLDRTRHKGLNPIVYWMVRAVLQPFFHVYFRLSRIGREHIPTEGPIIFAANHRSFLDPFVIATMARRPMYYVSKKELFARPWQAWVLNALGAFPIDRDNGDEDAMATAREILERGEQVLIFPEGTRIRHGSLGSPRRGVGRLALETGAPVVPLAVIGTDDIRRGWRVRPHKVRIRAGRPLTFPVVEDPSPQLAGAVTDRIWPCIELQWEWLGGLARLRRAAVIGAGSWGTACAVALARAGLEVDLGCRTAEQAEAIATTQTNDRYLPGITLPNTVTAMRCADLDVTRADLVVLAVPSRSLPAVIASFGGLIDNRAGVLVLAKGLVAPRGWTPVEYVSERVHARAVACLAGPGHAADALANGAALVAASSDRALLNQVKHVFKGAGFSIQTTTDVTGVELAATAKNAAVLAAATAAVAGPNAAGAAAGKVFAEVDAYARRCGGRPETFAGLAGAGDLVATVVAEGSRNRRAGELLGRGMPTQDIEPALGQTAESLDVLPLLAAALRERGVKAPAINGLADVVEGRTPAADWAHGVTLPGSDRRAPIRAA